MSQKKKEANLKALATQGKRKEKDAEESAGLKLVLQPGPVAAEKRAKKAMSFEEKEEARMKKVAAVAADPEGLLKHQSYNIGESILPKLPKHVEVLEEVVKKMKETYPATFAFMHYQWMRLPPSMRAKAISRTADYDLMQTDPQMKPFFDWLRRTEGSGGAENEMRLLARRSIIGQKMMFSEMWQEADAALAEMKSEEETLEVLFPEEDLELESIIADDPAEEMYDEDGELISPSHSEEPLDMYEEEDEGEASFTMEEMKEEWDKEIKTQEALFSDPELHVVLHYMVNPRSSIDPSGALQRAFNPELISEVDTLAIIEQRAKLNRIMLGFKRNLLQETPELENTPLLELYTDATIPPTDPQEKAAWEQRMAAAEQQLRNASAQGLTADEAYHHSLESFKEEHDVDFVPNPVALRILIDTMQQTVDDYNPELKALIERVGDEDAEEILITQVEDFIEEKDHARAADSPPSSEALDLEAAEVDMELIAELDQVDPEELDDAMHPMYSSMVLREFIDAPYSIDLIVNEARRKELTEIFTAHVDAFVHGKPLDPKYMSEEDKALDAAETSEQHYEVVKRIMDLPDANTREMTRELLADYTRTLAADMGLVTPGEDVLDAAIEHHIDTMRSELENALENPGNHSEEQIASMQRAIELLDNIEAPFLCDEEDEIPVGDPRVQWAQAKHMLRTTKDTLIHMNTELGRWEARLDGLFEKARTATKRMLDPENASTMPDHIQKLKALHESVYGTELPNPLKSVSSDDIMAEWARAVKEQLMLEEARTSVQRERDAVANTMKRQSAPLSTVPHPPIVPESIEESPPIDNGFYPFSTSDMTELKPVQDRIYLNTDGVNVEDIFVESNVGRYLNFSEREIKKYLPEGFSVHLTRREFAYTKSKALLLRKEALGVIENLKRQLEDGFVLPANADSKSVDAARSMMLHGHRGSGKSAVMSEVVYWARRSGWLVVYVPDGNAYLNGGVYINKNAQEGTWDQPKLFVRMFGHLVSAHADKLKEINLRTPTKVGKIEAKTLFDVVEYGSVLEQYAAQCFSVFKSEIKKVTQFPVLFAFDSYNSLYTPCLAFRDPESTSYYKDPMDPYNMTVGRLFYDAHVNHKLSYGTFLGAVTDSAPIRPFINHTPDLKLHPGAQLYEPKYLEVKPYSMTEFTTVMEHYKHKNYVRTSMSSGSASEMYIYQLTSGFPGAVWSYSKKL